MGGHGSGRPPSVESILNRLNPQSNVKAGYVAGFGVENIVIPNHSGDHSKGKVNTTPVNDLDIANKKYVDDSITAASHSPVTVTDGSTINFTLTGQDITAETIDSAINHDNLLNFVANEHIDWTNASSNLRTSGTGEFGGTTSGLGKLNVTGFGSVGTMIAHFYGDSASSFARIAIDTATGEDSAVSFMEAGSSKWTIGNDGTDDSFHIKTSAAVFATTDPIQITTGGDFGIGAAPEARLDVKTSSGTPLILERTGASDPNRWDFLVSSVGSLSANSLFIEPQDVEGDVIFRDVGNTVTMAIDHSANSVQINKGNAPPRRVLDVGGTMVVDGIVGIGADTQAAKVDISQTSTTGAIPCLELDQDDVDFAFINFEGTFDDTDPVTSGNLSVLGADDLNPTGPDRTYWQHAGMIKINVNSSGNSYWIPYYLFT